MTSVTEHLTEEEIINGIMHSIELSSNIERLKEKLIFDDELTYGNVNFLISQPKLY